MASRVLLISVNTCASPYPVYPIGCAHISAALTQAGHSVTMADCNVDDERIEKIIADIKPDAVGLSLRNIDDIQIRNTRLFVNDLSRLVARVKAATIVPIVLGGSGYSLFPKELLSLVKADFGIVGEGETAFVSLLAAMENCSSVRNIPGLVYDDCSSIVAVPPAVQQPKDIPLATYDSRLAEFYRVKSSMIGIQTQRGCASSCCYCTYPVIEGRTVRPRDPLAIVEEFAALASLNIGYTFIVDSVFNSSVEHVHTICEALIAKGNKLPWGCFLKPCRLSQDLLSLMARAGLKHIEFGSDSFCDSVLTEYEKGFVFEDIYKSSEYARIANVHYAHFLILGGPGETRETLRISFENSKHLRQTAHFPFVGMRIYPGTQLYKRALAEKIITPETDLTAPVFYITPHISQADIFTEIKSFSEQSANWIVGDLPPENQHVVDMLREKGLTGPLWEYLVR